MARAGRTAKISISLDPESMATLEARAKRVAGGNLSAAVADALRVAKEHEGRAALGKWLREAHGDPSEEELDAVDAEWAAARAAAAASAPSAPKPPRRPRAAKRRAAGA